MGTNYYLNGKHLGKRSNDNFLWAGTEELPTPKKIVEWINSVEGIIEDEFGNRFSKDDFFNDVATDESRIRLSQRVNFCEGFC